MLCVASSGESFTTQSLTITCFAKSPSTRRLEAFYRQPRLLKGAESLTRTCFSMSRSTRRFEALYGQPRLLRGVRITHRHLLWRLTQNHALRKGLMVSHLSSWRDLGCAPSFRGIGWLRWDWR